MVRTHVVLRYDSRRWRLRPCVCVVGGCVRACNTVTMSWKGHGGKGPTGKRCCVAQARNSASMGPPRAGHYYPYAIGSSGRLLLITTHRRRRQLTDGGKNRLWRARRSLTPRSNGATERSPSRHSTNGVSFTRAAVLWRPVRER